MAKSTIIRIAALLAISTLSAFSQTRATQVLDASALKPPPAARVAIVEFADYQCPACAHHNPTLVAAAAQYHIPLVRHDFPLPIHHWSFQAAVYARWFDTKSTDFGEQYRNAVYLNQRNIETAEDLRVATEKFAADRKLSLPFAVDPQNKLADAVKADADLGRRTGIHETPTVFIVSSTDKGQPYVQVTDMSQLYSIIDRALATSPQTAGKGK